LMIITPMKPAVTTAQMIKAALRKEAPNIHPPFWPMISLSPGPCKSGRGCRWRNIHSWTARRAWRRGPPRGFDARHRGRLL
jgi:hypothetical protein